MEAFSILPFVEVPSQTGRYKEEEQLKKRYPLEHYQKIPTLLRLFLQILGFTPRAATATSPSSRALRFFVRARDVSVAPRHVASERRSAVPRLIQKSESPSPPLRSTKIMKDGRSRDPVLTGYMYSGV